MEPDDEDLRKLLSEAGIDIRRDIEEILIGTTGDSENSKSLIIARGQFHPVQFIAAASARGASVANWHGIQVATLKGAKSDGAVAFIDSGVALVGDAETVRAAIDRSGASSNLSPELQTRMRELSATNDAWFLSNGPPGDFFAGKLADENLGDAVHSNLLAAVLEARGGLKFEPDGVRFAGTAIARSEKDATALRDVVKFIAGLVQVDKASKATLAQSLQATAERNVVRLSLSMPEAVVEQLFLKAQAGKADGR
jgi:hypothetical protein